MKKLLFTTIIILSLFTPLAYIKANTPIKILLVPGHDNEAWGAQYGNIKEADMNLNLATRIYNTLKKDKRFEVHITRKIGGHTKEFEDYFANNTDAISAFRESVKAKMKKKVEDGSFIKKENAPHNSASEDVAIKLYGINKWANENKIDAVIHIHFNDYPRPNKWTKGIHKGFTIYKPEAQMVNSKESSLLAEKIFTQLRKKYMTSTYEPEKGGFVEDQSLIALGSNGSLLPSVRSVLIEYGYIYRFPTRASRFASYDNMASFTTTGVKNYFFAK